MKKEMKMYATPEVETCEILLKTGICSGFVDVTVPGQTPGDNEELNPELGPSRALIKLH